ncbi:hypothetical protein LTR91_022794 [Friedmanniomyces endolithicus]|uniref:Uncharacterized protein n=1 Tax=Friedmanniomyces endolithicus TaxID=329885 RepID=A0AAN6IZJ4_9PEZI|nr:hypothetical protein LTR35_017456 [Friedmanniomyces endolithicus]KAK0269665.1 hypothetical protein LTS00_017195 [Friedmanniomyces endolithicus]KAK0302268.1 hypothetical protein LTR01_008865 [Friedmanniomyces endolithicus]KAK0303097.1 hypothetical protein LTR82_017658 [Friedmanniomyces endolithicus]KAK0822981.1 hypothetical protein LTR73_008873 [Friedmanniomyces endolithicus]
MPNVSPERGLSLLAASSLPPGHDQSTMRGPHHESTEDTLNLNQTLWTPPAGYDIERILQELDRPSEQYGWLSISTAGQSDNQFTSPW